MIEFLGRIDHQVKIRGFRIELGEIEAVLAEYPSYGAGRCDGSGRRDRRQAPGGIRRGRRRRRTQLVSGLRAIVARKLPDACYPAAYVVLDAMPLSPNGKVDRKALPAPEDAARTRHVATVPWSDLEREIANVWREGLRVDDMEFTTTSSNWGAFLAMQLTRPA